MQSEKRTKPTLLGQQILNDYSNVRPGPANYNNQLNSSIQQVKRLERSIGVRGNDKVFVASIQSEPHPEIPRE